MPIFQCAQCGYQTRRKHCIVAHLNKKLPCINQVLVVDAEIMREAEHNLACLTTENIRLEILPVVPPADPKLASQ